MHPSFCIMQPPPSTLIHLHSTFDSLFWYFVFSWPWCRFFITHIVFLFFSPSSIQFDQSSVIVSPKRVSSWWWRVSIDRVIDHIYESASNGCETMTVPLHLFAWICWWPSKSMKYVEMQRTNTKLTRFDAFVPCSHDVKKHIENWGRVTNCDRCRWLFNGVNWKPITFSGVESSRFFSLGLLIHSREPVKFNACRNQWMGRLIRTSMESKQQFDPLNDDISFTFFIPSLSCLSWNWRQTAESSIDFQQQSRKNRHRRWKWSLTAVFGTITDLRDPL
jgi:hypothetical protein